MAATTLISQKELKRQAALAFEGKTINVMLCQVGVTGYGAESLVSDWQTVEISGNGYSRYSEIVLEGSYNSGSGSYVLPVIDAVFTASVAGYDYDRVVIYFDGESYPHSIIIEDPNVLLVSGQTQTYRLTLIQDD